MLVSVRKADGQVLSGKEPSVPYNRCKIVPAFPHARSEQLGAKTSTIHTTSSQTASILTSHDEGTLESISEMLL